MSWVAVGIAGVGAATSVLGATAPGRDTRQTRDMFYQTQGKSQWEQLQSLYGEDADLAYLASSIGPEWRQHGTDSGAIDRAIQAIAPGRSRADLERFIQRNPGYNARQNALIAGTTARQGADLGYFDEQASGIQRTIDTHNRDLMRSYGATAGRTAQGYNQATAATTGVYRDYGTEMEKSIREDLDLANRSADARAAASSVRRGGSSTNDQMVLAGVRAENSRGANKSIADVRQRKAELVGGATERGLTNKARSLQDLWTSQLGMEQDRASAAEGFQSNRLSARMGLENAYLSNDYAMRSDLNRTNLSTLNDIANAQRMAPIVRQGDPNPALPQIGAQLFGAGTTMLGDWYESGRSNQGYNAPRPRYDEQYGPPNR